MKRCRCASAKLCSVVAVCLALLPTSSRAEFVYVANQGMGNPSFNGSVSAYSINPTNGGPDARPRVTLPYRGISLFRGGGSLKVWLEEATLSPFCAQYSRRTRFNV
jgi:hypothetical protein